MALDIEYQEKSHTGRRVSLVVFIIVVGFLGWAGYNWYSTGNTLIPVQFHIADTSVDESAVTAHQVATYTVPALRPRYIAIPSLHLESTRVFPTGLDSDNLLKATGNINDAAWYNKSDLPGNDGVIVMEGHNEGISKKGAFSDISTLKHGDKVLIERGDGRKYTYLVVDGKNLSLDDINSKDKGVLGQSAIPGKQALNLVTFDGKWVPRLGTFDRRVIVRTVIDDNSKR